MADAAATAADEFLNRGRATLPPPVACMPPSNCGHACPLTTCCPRRAWWSMDTVVSAPALDYHRPRESGGDSSCAGGHTGIPAGTSLFILVRKHLAPSALTWFTQVHVVCFLRSLS